jgi:hypothetical protein
MGAVYTDAGKGAGGAERIEDGGGGVEGERFKQEGIKQVGES